MLLRVGGNRANVGEMNGAMNYDGSHTTRTCTVTLSNPITRSRLLRRVENLDLDAVLHEEPRAAASSMPSMAMRRACKLGLHSIRALCAARCHLLAREQVMLLAIGSPRKDIRVPARCVRRIYMRPRCSDWPARWSGATRGCGRSGKGAYPRLASARSVPLCHRLVVRWEARPSALAWKARDCGAV